MPNFEPRFQNVADIFNQALADDPELGGAFCIYQDGVPVVDLWGGPADVDAGTSWEADTLCVLQSQTKGMLGFALAILIDRGDLELDRPVAAYWPEFASNGKEDLTVAELVSHRSRLIAFEEEMQADDLLDPIACAERLASQPRADGPEAVTYHGVTHGYLCGELIRRVDGRSVGSFFADEIAGPLGLDAWIGLPPSEEDRVCALRFAPGWEELEHWPFPPLIKRVYFNPPIFEEPFMFNSPRVHAAELAFAGGIGDARSIARMYACLAGGGVLEGVRLLSSEAVDLVRRPLNQAWDSALERPQSYGVSFQLRTTAAVQGPPAAAFGHTGAGGMTSGAWPEHGVAFCALNNLLVLDEVCPHTVAMLDAAYQVLSA